MKIRWGKNYTVKKPIKISDKEGGKYRVYSYTVSADYVPICDTKRRLVTDHEGRVLARRVPGGEITIVDAHEVYANIYPAAGRVLAEIYGERLNYMLNMLCQIGDVEENDGVCVNVGPGEDPDYRVIAVKRYTDHLLCTLESEHR